MATVGTFDGLHKGHQRVIATLKQLARERNLQPMVVTFDRHPLETIAPERAPRLIQSPSERTNQLFREGIHLHVMEFTPQAASMSAREWMRAMHRDHGVDVLVVGYDNTFGHDGIQLDIADYKRMGREEEVEVVEAPYEPHAASSAIRRLLAEGNVEEAAHLLGRPFAVTGTVRPGKHLGASIGFPTANVEPSYRAQLPQEGVYAVEAVTPQGTMTGLANVGRQPTVGEGLPLRLEVHIPGFSGNLYDQRLTVRFLRKIRDEQKFDSLDQLRSQIAADLTSLSSKS